MASAWGESWGSAWGSAWGDVSLEDPGVGASYLHIEVKARESVINRLWFAMVHAFRPHRSRELAHGDC